MIRLNRCVDKRVPSCTRDMMVMNAHLKESFPSTYFQSGLNFAGFRTIFSHLSSRDFVLPHYLSFDKASRVLLTFNLPGWLFKIWCTVCEKREYYWNRKRYNYEIKGILWEVKRILGSIS